MKKFLGLLVGLLIVAFITLPAYALQFNVDAGDSSIVLSNTSTDGFFGSTSLSVALDIPYDNPFVLDADGASTTVDFAIATISGCGIAAWGSSDVTATIAFNLGDSPYISGGSTQWATIIGGVFDGGNLTWNTAPGIITLDNGDWFDVHFNDIAGISLLQSQYTIQATVTGHSAPVPEPATMLLFGIGILGIAGVSRKKTA